MNAPLKQTNITCVSAIEIDPRIAFMARAGACHDLVVLGELGIGEAFDGLIDQFENIVGYDTCPTCEASACANPSFCALSRELDKRRRRK